MSQTEIAKAAKGMLVAFIDFTKAYDIDRGKMWWCLERLGVNGRFLNEPITRVFLLRALLEWRN